MRVTLRLLLAFRSGMLHPDVRREVVEKLESNPAIQRLFKKLNTLEGSECSGRSFPLNANDIAAYLSNDLSGPQLHTFEKACLKQDAALAEVVDCYEILAITVSEAPVRNSALKARLVGLLDMPSI